MTEINSESQKINEKGIYRRVRILAFFTDIFLVGVITSLLFFILKLPKSNSSIIFNSSIGYLVYFIYSVIFETSKLKATPGKYLFKIKLFKPLSESQLDFFKRVVWRNFFKIFSIGFFGIGLMKYLFKRSNKTAHDQNSNVSFSSDFSNIREIRLKLVLITLFHFSRSLYYSGFNDMDYNFNDSLFRVDKSTYFSIYETKKFYNSLNSNECEGVNGYNYAFHHLLMYINKIFDEHKILVSDKCIASYTIFYNYGYETHDDYQSNARDSKFNSQTKKLKFLYSIKNQIIIILTEFGLFFTQYLELIPEISYFMSGDNSLFRSFYWSYDLLEFRRSYLNHIYYDDNLNNTLGINLLLNDVFWYRTIIPSFRNLITIHVYDYSKLISSDDK